MIKRILEKKIRDAATYYPVLGILGPRQSGKTTLVQQIFTKHTYVTLEDFDIRFKAQNEPRAFLAEHMQGQGLILDEIQHAPQLLSYIQTIVDREKKMGYFIVTGSQNILVNAAITQSLAGRIGLFTLFPFSITELEEAKLLPDTIEEVIIKGSYPRAYSGKIPVNELYADYITTYVERDARQMKNITELDKFQHFIQLCAARSGQLLNLSALGAEAKVDHKTAQAWISILQATYIIYLLYPYYKNLGKRLVKSPKLYFVDTGLACSLLKIKTPEQLQHSEWRGPLVESYIISDFFKQYYNIKQRPSLYFWRDHDGNEIDCVVEEALTLTPIEIKAGKKFSRSYLETLSYWKDLAKIKTKSIVVYAGTQNRSFPKSKVIGWKDAGEIIQSLQ